MREIKFKAKRVDNGEWVDLNGYEGFYQINQLGQLRSIDRYVNHWQGGKCFKKGKLLKPSKNQKGYLMVNIRVNGVGGLKSVHRLVANQFISNPRNKPQVNHIDGNKENNKVSNLEWNTQSENQIHAFKNGLNKGSMKGVKGKFNPRTILSDNDVRKLRNKILDGVTKAECAKIFNVSERTIYRTLKTR